MRATRWWIALVATTMLVPSLASADNVSQPSFVFAFTSQHGDALLWWTPVAGATSYLVSKGPDVDHLVVVDRTSDVIYHDVEDSADGIVVYAVAAIVGAERSPWSTIRTSSQNSDCVATQGSEFEVYAENCVRRT